MDTFSKISTRENSVHAKIILKLNNVYFDMWKGKKARSCQHQMPKRVTTLPFIIWNKNCFKPKEVTWSQFVFSVNFHSISIPSTIETKGKFSSAQHLYSYIVIECVFETNGGKFNIFATIIFVEYSLEAFLRLQCWN